MRKIVGDEFSFFGNSADTLLPAGAALIGFAAKPADPVSAPSFFGAANDVLQAGALTVSSFDVAASNGTFMTTTLGSGHMSASAEPAANNDSKYGSSGAGPTGGAFVANSEPALQNDPQSGTGGVFPNPETVTLAGSGLVFVNTYGAGVTDPFHTAIIYAEHELQSNFTNSVTIRVSFDFGDAHGFLAYNSFFNVRDTSFANLKTALTAHATSADDIAAVNAFPTAAPSNTHSNSTNTGFWVAAGLQQILGAPGTTLFPNASIDDALILGNGFSWNFDPNNRAAGGYDAIGAIEHEISEGGMGRIGGLGYQNNTWGPMDLFRFTSSGVRDFTGGQDGVTTYFSPNGANPDLTHPYHNSVNAQGTFDGQDPADWQVGGDSFGFGSPGVPGLLSETDLRVMDILGWTRDDFPATTSTTGVVSVHGSATGNLEVAGDHDWFRVQLTAGVQYTIDERGQSVGAGTLSDPFMALYNAAGQFITSNDDGGGSLNSRIVYTPTVTGSYYIDAGAYQDQYSGTYRVSVGTGHFDYAGIWTSASNGSDNTWHVGDFNGDGKTDIFRYLPGQSGADVFLSNGSSFVHDSSWTGAGFGTDGTWHLGDFNGDGKTDIFRYLPGQSGADVFLSNGTKFVHDASWTGAGFGTDGTWHLGDFNGDGKTDIFRYLPGQSGADVFLSNGSKFVHDASWTGAGIGSDNQWHVGDFNGDGADDVFRQLSGVDMFLSHFG
jgi:hypothetical protein